MAPKRKQTTAGDSSSSSSSAATRVTRRLANSTVAPPAADAEPPKRKKGKTTATAVKPEGEAKSPLEQAADGGGGGKTIIIERSTECSRFKTRAIQVKEGLEKGVAGVKVVVNPEKPRRGCFEIREEGGEVFLSLLDMKRPYKPMTDLDMEEVISDIIEKIR
ncbi:selenoprotein H [Sesamum indicum]|uniref:Selenoprotein H n=1 Tax=Sesamum indicum TaxID=4182 RepID=A0A6I9T9J6_SESIN|nr:selenoprotein H [Sesamum indicum]